MHPRPGQGKQSTVQIQGARRSRVKSVLLLTLTRRRQVWRARGLSLQPSERAVRQLPGSGHGPLAPTTATAGSSGSRARRPPEVAQRRGVLSSPRRVAPAAVPRSLKGLERGRPARFGSSHLLPLLAATESVSPRRLAVPEGTLSAVALRSRPGVHRSGAHPKPRSNGAEPPRRHGDRPPLSLGHGVQLSSLLCPLVDIVVHPAIAFGERVAVPFEPSSHLPSFL